MKEYYVIGLMSGTSLDGLDIAYCKFTESSCWSFDILAFKTYSYQPSFQNRLRDAVSISDHKLNQLSADFGDLMSVYLIDFKRQFNITLVDLVASHGHTIFHNPEQGFTLQIGDPEPIYKTLSIPIVYDFRTADISRGGQGAPLVPIVDRLLFSSYGACLNLGGFSNISFDVKAQRVAFDICPVNIVLNHLANQIGMMYDADGIMAKKGRVDVPTLNALNELPYYKKSFPKSLAWEWVDACIFPILEKSNLSTNDALRTFVQHIVEQISSVVKRNQLTSVLISGGGAYNTFLIDELNKLNPSVYCTANAQITEGKEAMAFGFLGLLKFLNRVNVLSSVTGSDKDHISGLIFEG